MLKCTIKEDVTVIFLREVNHMLEAWINLDATKIGYEISSKLRFL
jgi:type I restriction enzyme M protein